MHWRDRHFVLADRAEVGPVFELPCFVRQLDPIIGKIAFIHPTDGPKRPGQPAALGRDPRAADLFRRRVGKVDVDEAAWLPVADQQPLKNRRRETARR